MNTFFTEVRQTLVPRGEVKHGPLPPLLVAMTLITGLVDAFSYLVLGHVFVANMTGNVVFLAFALAGASRLSGGVGLLRPGFPGRGAPWVAPWPAPGAPAQRSRSAANALAECLGSSGRAVRQSGVNRLQLWPYHRAGHRDGTPERHRSKARCARPDDHRPHLDHRRHLCRQSSRGRKRIESRSALDFSGSYVRGCPRRESADISRFHRVSARDRPHRHSDYRGNDGSAFAHEPDLGPCQLARLRLAGPRRRVLAT